MLGKLLKQDMKTMSRFACPMFIASAAVTIVCCTMLYFTFSFAEEADTLWGAMIVVGSFYVMGLIAIIIMAAIVSVMTAVRYYKSLFTDEGYLNMVLPVKTSTMFNAKILTTVIWSTLASAVAVVCCVISFIVPTLLYDKEILDSFFVDIDFFLTLITGNETMSAILSVLGTINTITGVVEGVLIIITAITVGSVVMKKNRVLGSILFYFIITFIQENVISIFQLIVTLAMGSLGEGGAIASSIFNLVVNIGVTVGMYFISYFILNKKFNIE